MSKRIVLMAGVSLLVSFFFLRCTEDEIVGQAETELYSGDLEIFRPGRFEYRTDTVSLIIRSNTYDLTHVTHQTNICDSKGSASGYGTPTLYLSSPVFTGSNCDSLRIPKGAFSATFRGDSLYLERHADSASLDVIYRFRLVK